MKTRGKVLLATLSAAMLVTASVMGTLAYLQDSETVTNTFTVGKVDITLTETAVDVNGDPIKGEEPITNGGEQFYKLMPGHDYTKDPVVTVIDDSEDAWVFVKVVNPIAGIEENGEGVDTIAEQIVDNGWTALTGVANVYYRAHTQDTEKDTPYTVFENFTIKGTETNDTLDDYANKSITITAYAIQKDGFNDTAKTDAENAAAAWTAGNFA